MKTLKKYHERERENDSLVENIYVLVPIQNGRLKQASGERTLPWSC